MGRRSSILIKFLAVFILSAILAAGAFSVAMNYLRIQVSRNEAHAVADQVRAFRAWVAQSGMAWVHKLAPGFPDYLEKQECGTDGHIFYGKNPALATRELAMVSKKEGSRAAFRVTSDNVRRKENTPDSFEIEAMRRFTKDKELFFVEQYEGEQYRYAQPLLVEQSCLLCHGDPKDAPPSIIEKYGREKGFGYKVGQVRGIVSVTVPSLSTAEVLWPLLNPYSIGLVCAIVVLNIVFVRALVHRIDTLTLSIEAIATGKLDTQLLYLDSSESSDEIDQLYHAVNQLKRSMTVLFKRVNSA